MQRGLRWLRRIALPLAVQGLVFWAVLAVLGKGAVDGRTWPVLHLLLAISLVAVQWAPRWAPRVAASWSARMWLVVALYALYFAAFFAGANFALDALHGAQRMRADVPAQLGGLELWQFLCPGVFSLALGALVGRQGQAAQRTCQARDMLRP